MFYTTVPKKDPRLSELVGGKELKDPQYVLLGWPDDRGIIANKGRPGAKEGPDAIRKAFLKCTPGIHEKKVAIADWGNFTPHEVAAKQVEEALKIGAIPICMGGGNDYAFADLMGVRAVIGPQETLGVINIDAHFDVRDLTFGVTSGTPYFQALENKLMKGEHFVEFGIQPAHNSPFHFKYLQEKKARIVTLENIQLRGARKLFYEQLQFLKQSCDTIVVSLDIDSVKQSDAPGCSAPYPNGLSANDVEEIAKVAGEEPKVKLFSVYEVSPPLDRDGQTAALAASAIWNFIYQTQNALPPN